MQGLSADEVRVFRGPPDTGQLVAGRPNHKIQNSEYWTFVHREGKWLLDEVERDI